MKNIKLGIALLAFSGISILKAQDDKKPDLNYFINDLNKDESPCENFYNFAVGKWLSNNPIPKTESSWGSFNVLQIDNEKKQKAILDNLKGKNFPKYSAEQLVGDFYAAAMDSVKFDKQTLQSISKELKLIDGIKSKEDFINQLPYFHSFGNTALFGIYVGIDSKNSVKNALYLGQSGLGLPDRDYYLKTDDNSKSIIAAYKTFIVNTFVLAGENKANAEKLSNQIFELEKSLAENNMNRVDRRDPDKTYNKMTVAALTESTGTINWKSYLSKSGLDAANELIVNQPEYMIAMAGIFSKTDLSLLKNYLKYHTLITLSPYINSAFEKESFSFYSTVLRGIKEMKPRWNKSLSVVNSNIGQPLGKLYVEKHFSPKAKKYASQMVENLRDAYRDRIKEVDWMSAETKEKAMEKLESFTYKIGFPDKWIDYKGLEISKTDFVRNVINCKIFSKNYNFAKYGNPVDKQEWFMNPQTVNAYYSPNNNEIVFPAAILQEPFFSENYDDALNYGGIGAVIGHEFTHGFDDKGSKYDASGNLNNWWNDEDREKFENKTKKLIEQFDAYSLAGLNVNGKLTLGENIADLGGLKLAYYAMNKKLNKEGKDGYEEGGFTHNQRFFYAWAQVWKKNATDESLRVQINTDPHSPSEFRVIGPLSLLNEFKAAFDCIDGQMMVVPEDRRIDIW